jgi:hypothetical protein
MSDEEEGVRDAPRRVDRARASSSARGWRSTGVQTVSDYIRLGQLYRLEDVIGEVTTPTLVTDAEKEYIAQGKQLCDALTSPKEFVFFEDAEGGAGRCEGMGQALFNKRLYDWLDEVVPAQRV